MITIDVCMETVFPDSTIRYRAIDNTTLQTVAYAAIIAAETLTAILCWIGAVRLLAAARGDASGFQRAKTFAILGLTCGFLVWQVGFQSIGGECFGMWRSTTWNGEDSAFRDYITILAVLIYVTLREPDLA